MRIVQWEVYDPVTGASLTTCATRAEAVQAAQAAQRENGRDYAARTVPDYGQLSRAIAAADHEALLDPRGPDAKWPEKDEIEKAVYITLSDHLKLLQENAELRGLLAAMMLQQEIQRMVLHSGTAREGREQYRWLRWRITETHQVVVWLEELDTGTGGSGRSARLTIQESEENK